MSLISLMLVLSFAFIPVRCDASTAPHSIFVSPNMLNPSGGHQHHDMSAVRSQPSKMIAHHSPLMIDADSGQPNGHQHMQSPVTTGGSDIPTGDPSTPQLANGSDPGSQQPMGATLDLPPASVTAESMNLPQLGQESGSILFAPTSVLHGITSVPIPPPPKSV